MTDSAAASVSEPTGIAWIDALVAEIEVAPRSVGGRPGIAVFIPEPPAAEKESLRYVGAINILQLVQGDDGQPWIGVARRGFRDVSLPVSLRPVMGRMHPLVHWLSGYAAWDAFLAAWPGEAAETMEGAGGGVPAHVSRLIAEAVPNAGFDAAFAEGLLAVGGWGWGPCAPLDKLFKRTTKGGNLRRFVRANPFLTEVAYLETVSLIGNEGDPPLDVVMPGLTAAALRKLRAPAWSKEAGRHGILTGNAGACRNFQNFVPHVPPEWLPTEGGDVWAFLESFMLLGNFDFEALPARQLIDSSRGNWAAFLLACFRAYGGTTRDARMEIFLGDPARDFAQKVVAPLVERAALSRDERWEVLDPYRQAFRLIYGDKSLPACIEASVRWHARLPRLLAEMPSDADEDVTWPELYPEAVVAGLVVKPLLSARDLAEEGAAGPDRDGVRGLDHCAASYRAAAWRGDSYVYSVRQAKGDGGFRRLATVEFVHASDGGIVARQVSGLRNLPPTARVAKAVDAYVEMHRDAPLPKRRGRKREEEVREDCGFDFRDDALMERACLAYGFMLPRGLRGDVEALSRVILATRRTARA